MVGKIIAIIIRDFFLRTMQTQFGCIKHIFRQCLSWIIRKGIVKSLSCLFRETYFRFYYPSFELTFDFFPSSFFIPHAMAWGVILYYFLICPWIFHDGWIHVRYDLNRFWYWNIMFARYTFVMEFRYSLGDEEIRQGESGAYIGVALYYCRKYSFEGRKWILKSRLGIELSFSKNNLNPSSNAGKPRWTFIKWKKIHQSFRK